MTDWKDFDDALRDAVADLPPPEDTVQTVTPFRAAIRSVTAGLCLSFFTLDAWYLQYLLPALGAVLLCLGTRSLRNNSRWFCFMWIISVCEALSLYCNTMLRATRLPDLTAFPWLSLGLRAALLVCLHLGLRQAAAETGHSPKGAPVLWALVWYGVLVLLGIFWPQPGWIVFLTMAAAFVCIVRSLLRVSAQLSEAGYSLRAAPVRVSGGKLAAAYLLSLAVLTAGLSLAANHLPVEGHPLEQLSGSSETAAIRTDLKALGFPEDLLDLLPETEIAKLSGAEGVQVNLERLGGQHRQRRPLHGSFCFDLPSLRPLLPLLHSGYPCRCAAEPGADGGQQLPPDLKSGGANSLEQRRHSLRCLPVFRRRNIHQSSFQSDLQLLHGPVQLSFCRERPPGLVRLHSLLCSRRMARQRLHSPLSDAGPAEPIPLCTTA